MDTAYSLVLQGDHLLAQHPRNPSASLRAEAPDVYNGSEAFLRRLEFERDDEGYVTGFLLTTERVWNLRVQRLAHGQQPLPFQAKPNIEMELPSRGASECCSTAGPSADATARSSFPGR